MKITEVMNKIVMIIVIGLLSGCLETQNGTGEVLPMNTGKLPIVYSPNYSIELLGLEKLHPFDTAKYKKIYDALISESGLMPEHFYSPEEVTQNQLLLVHSETYLNALKDPTLTARIAGVPEISLIPPHLIEESIYSPMKYATGGTILAVSLALSKGWAINLSGGYHHAKAETGGGFCYFADIPIAVNILWQKNAELRVLIVDLDAHQGNGYADIFADDPRIFIYDMYNKDIYPMDTEAARFIDFVYPIKSGTSEKEYLTKLKATLPEAIAKAKPDIVIFNAGTDPFEEDPLGGLRLSTQGIIDRDKIVFNNALAGKIPICMVLSGGYTKKSAGIIHKSIVEILTTVIPKYISAE